MKLLYKLTVLLLLFLASSNLFAQQITVLPGNNNYSPQSGPQGALRAQRQFYLIRPSEMQASGLAGGTTISQIGFTIGVQQSIATKGAFKVWLQNTTDQISRVDNVWKETIVSINSLSSRFFPGDYDVEVIPTTCATAFDTLRFSFSNRNLVACMPPTGLTTTAITATSATFNWVAPANAPGQYKVMYKSIDDAVWTNATTATTSYNAAGLLQNKTYQWRVRSSCGTDSSEIAGADFMTLITSVCNAPTGFSIARKETSPTDTLAVLKWNAAAGATFYDINYRRVGTTTWLTAISFNDSLVVRHLLSGTDYEWRIKTNCGAGSGDFKNAGTFTTLGTTRCFAPYNLAVNTITDSTAVIAWSAYTGVTSHKIRYRLKGTIEWTNVISGMTQVHNDSLTIPATTGLDTVSFVLGSPFTYTANSGVYVAWEYSRVTGPLSTPNISVSTTVDSVRKDVNGQDSIRYALSFSSRNDSSRVAQDSIVTSSAFRPETLFGSSSLKDSVAVLAVWTLGKTAPRFQDSITVSAQLSNRMNTAKKLGVKLLVKEQLSGTVRYTQTDSITIRALTDTVMTFRRKSLAILENDSVIVSIEPIVGENLTNNNVKGFLQSVNTNLLAYADATVPITNVGFDAAAGLLLTKYNMKGCGKVIAAQVFLTSSANGHSTYAVIRNSAGAIVAQSASLVADSNSINRYHSFYFNTPVSFQDEDFYIGLAQPASATPFRPVGSQWENSVNRAGAFFKANLDGSNLVDSSGFGRLMIRAEIIPSSPQPFIDSVINGKLYLCTGGTKTLNAGSIEQRFADSVLNYSSQNANSVYHANEVLGTPNVFPASGTIPGAWLSENPDGPPANRHETLTLRFPGADAINFVDIYETSNPGAVDTVWVKNSVTLAYDTVFTRIPDTTLANTSRKFHVAFPLTANPVTEIKISLNSGKIPGYNAIDAVAIGRSTVPATYSNYLWTGPGIVGSTTTQAITINAIGTYKVEVTTATGCPVSSDSVIVEAMPAAVSISPAGPLNLCIGDSIWLKSSMKGGNTWSNGSTSDSIKVKTTGTYSLTNNVGCGVLTSNSVVVTVIPKPTITISGNRNICPTLSTTLDAGAGYGSYLWKNAGGATISTTQTATISTPGLIRVIVDSIACRDSATALVLGATSPTPVITGTLQFCGGSSTILDAGAFSSYEWRNGANAIVGTTRTITVTTADNFTVKVSNAAGCFGTSAPVTTSLLPYTPPTISGNASFCFGSSEVLTASPGYAFYRWTPGNIISQTLTITTAGTYTVTATALNGCEGSVSKTVTTNPLPTPVISGSLVFCPGGDPTTLSTATGFSSYQWKNGAGTVIGTNNTVDVTSADNFTVTVTNSFGCAGTSPAVTTSLLPFTPPTISGNSSFCPGTSVTLTASAGYAGYLWKNSAGTTVGTTAVLAVTTADTYTVTVTAANGCKGSVSKTITQNTPPHPVISGLLQFCTGGSTTLDAGPGYSSYAWKNAAGNVLGTNQTFTTNTAGFIRVVVDSLGCSDSTSVTTTTVASLSTTITGTLSFCNGSSTTLDAGPGFASYTWRLNGGGIVGTNQTLQVFTAGNYTVTVTNAFGCSGTSPSVTTIVLALPIPSIAGNSAVCPAGTVTLTASPAGAGYLWSPGGATTQSIVVNTAGTYSVTVTGANGCSAIASKVITAATAPATPTITGVTAICTGSSTTLTANTGYAGYSWAPGGATTQAITVNTAGTYTVTVSNASGCTASANAVVTVATGVPAIPGPIAGTVGGLCNTTGNVYSIAAVPTADYYVWTVPFGATIVGPQSGTSITVNFSTLFTTGVIGVTAFNACGGNPTSNPRQLAVTSIPPAPGAITGPLIGLCQQVGLIYTVAPVFSATTYNWTVPAGVTITAGAGTNSITVNISNSFVTGDISVIAANTCGASPATKLTIQGTTAPPVAVNGSGIGDCRKDAQVYSITPVVGAVSYTWNAPPRSTILEGQGTTSIKVKFDDDFVTGDLCVFTNTSCGRSAYRCLTIFESPCPATIFYPNPTTGMIKALVKFGPYGKYQLMISNALNQKVYQKEFIWDGTDHIIDLSHLPPGVYDVTIYNSTYRRSTKMLKLNN